MSYEKSAHLYDLFDQKDNIEFFFHCASRADEILDIGAGTGRIAIPLAMRGLRLWCVEPSPAMRGQFSQKLAQHPQLLEKITIVPGEAAFFELPRSFQMAFLSGTFDHFINEHQRRSALENIARHLDPGGILVFDVFLGLIRDTHLSPAGRVTLGDRIVQRLVGGRVLPVDQQMMVEIVYEAYEGDHLIESIEESGLVGIIDRYGIHSILCESGFEIRNEWGGYEFKPYVDGDPLLLVEAVRKGD